MNSLKIALPNTKDVQDDRVEDLAISSQYPSPKIDTKANPPHAGIIFINWVSAGILVSRDTPRILYSFPHSYNYAPLAFASYEFTDGTVRSRGVLPFTCTVAVGAHAEVTIESDKTNVYIKHVPLFTPAAAQQPFNIKIRFYVFAERGRE